MSSLPSRVGEQLELSLDDVRLKLPWQGRCPRVLTRAYNALYSRREAKKSMGDLKDPAQGELFVSGEEAPRLYRGAPLLLPLFLVEE